METVKRQKTTLGSNPKYAFVRGWKRVAQDDLISVKIEIMKIFNIISDAAWQRRLKGRVIPNAEQMAEVEAVFKKYGVTKVWGL